MRSSIKRHTLNFLITEIYKTLDFSPKYPNRLTKTIRKKNISLQHLIRFFFESTPVHESIRETFDMWYFRVSCHYVFQTSRIIYSVIAFLSICLEKNQSIGSICAFVRKLFGKSKLSGSLRCVFCASRRNCVFYIHIRTGINFYASKWKVQFYSDIKFWWWYWLEIRRKITDKLLGKKNLTMENILNCFRNIQKQLVDWKNI